MKENKRSVTVGIFVTLGVIILVVGILILGGKQKRFEKTLLVTAVFDNAGGLKTGNNIWFSGVKIGTVKSIDFYGNAQVQVTMKIDEDVKKYIRKDAKAKIGSESLIGNKIIEIYGGTPSVAAVEEGDKLQVEKSMDPNEIMATLQENNKNLLKITSDLKMLSTDIVAGKGTVGMLFKDSLMAERFRTITANLQQASAATVKISGDFSNFTTKLNNKEGLANQLLTDTVVFSKIQSSVTKLQHTVRSTANMADSLKKATSQLNNTKSPIGVLLNDEKSAAHLKTTLENIEKSSGKLDENMEALKHNIFFRGYFKKKARQEAKQKAEELKKQ